MLAGKKRWGRRRRKRRREGPFLKTAAAERPVKKDREGLGKEFAKNTTAYFGDNEAGREKVNFLPTFVGGKEGSDIRMRIFQTSSPPPLHCVLSPLYKYSLTVLHTHAA